MKKIFILFTTLLSIFLVSCTNDSNTTKTTNDSAYEELVSKIAEYDDFNSNQTKFNNNINIKIFTGNQLPEDVDNMTIDSYYTESMSGFMDIDISNNYLNYEFDELGISMVIKEIDNRLTQFVFAGQITQVTYLDETIEEAVLENEIVTDILVFQDYGTYKKISESFFQIEYSIEDLFNDFSEIATFMIGSEDLGINEGMFTVSINFLENNSVQYTFETDILELSDWEHDVYRDRYMQVSLTETISAVEEIIQMDDLDSKIRYISAAESVEDTYPIYNEEMTYKLFLHANTTNFIKVYVEKGYYGICHSGGSVSNLSINFLDEFGVSRKIPGTYDYYFPETGYYYFRISGCSEDMTRTLSLSKNNDYYN